MSESNSTVQYRDIPGFPGYRVGDDGSVWSCYVIKRIGQRRVVSDRWKKLTPTIHRGRSEGRAYLYLNLHRDGKQTTFKVHQLVLLVFVGPRPVGFECRHLDGNPRNNYLSNLQWGTPKQNGEDRVKHKRLRCRVTRTGSPPNGSSS